MRLFGSKGSGIRITVFGKTDVGQTREHNEDTFLVADLSAKNASLQAEVRDHEIGAKGTLLVVADGMGGAAAGEVASEMAADTIYEHLVGSWSNDTENTPQQFAYRLKEAVEEANSRIHAYAKEHPENRGMGTTVTAVGVLDNHVYLTQVGDSRAYLIRRGKAVQLTKDQSLMQRLVDAGELTEEEAQRSERKNIILQALGPEGRVRVDLTYQRISRGDAILLCSDGLSGPVSNEELARAVSDNDDLVKVSSDLITLANERGGPDNITVIVARFTGDGLQEPADDATVGHEIYPLPDADEATEQSPILLDDSPPAPSRSSLIAAGVTAAAIVVGALLIAVL